MSTRFLSVGSGKIENMGLFSWLGDLIDDTQGPRPEAGRRARRDMSVLAVLVRDLAHRLPDEERERIGLELGESSHDPDTVTATPPEHTGPGARPDWKYVWSALIDASAHAGRIETLLEQQRAFFDFEDITRAAGTLREQINSAYNLMCTAPRMDGLQLDAGDDLDTVRRAVDLRRAEVVDAALASMRPEPAPDARTWTIDYDEHGGFVATSSDQSGDGTTPWKFWGSAVTAGSARHTLTWYFLDRPPQIDFDPPQTPRPYVRMGPDSDRSLEGPSVRDLLERRGPIYEQHLAACQSARAVLREHADDIEGHLAERAAELNATDPQLDQQHVLNPVNSPGNQDHGGFAHTVQWVPTHLVVGTNHGSWGDFGGHRGHVPFDIVEGLLGSDLDAFTDELFGDRITLLRTPAWAGPLYRIGGNGNHRIHTARMLNLPWLAAAVEVEATAPSWDMLDLIADDPDTALGRGQRFEKRIQERAVLVAGLIRRGIIGGELIDDGPQPTLHCRRLPAAWLLRQPQFAAEVNAVYESRYPGALEQLGVPLEIGTDPDAWTRWLTST